MGTLHIYVYREGLLARLGHDLRLSITPVHVQLDVHGVYGTFALAQVRVDGAWKDGRLDLTALSAGDLGTITRALREEILREEAVIVHGTLSGDGLTAHLHLTMNLQTRAIDVPVSRRNEAWVIDADLTPSVWGIRPYRTLAGGLRLQDRWRVHLALAPP